MSIEWNFNLKVHKQSTHVPKWEFVGDFASDHRPIPPPCPPTVTSLKKYCLKDLQGHLSLGRGARSYWLLLLTRMFPIFENDDFCRTWIKLVLLGFSGGTHVTSLCWALRQHTMILNTIHTSPTRCFWRWPKIITWIFSQEVKNNWNKLTACFHPTV